jgi:hypothetical protein
MLLRFSTLELHRVLRGHRHVSWTPRPMGDHTPIVAKEMVDTVRQSALLSATCHGNADTTSRWRAAPPLRGERWPGAGGLRLGTLPFTPTPLVRASAGRPDKACFEATGAPRAVRVGPAAVCPHNTGHYRSRCGCATLPALIQRVPLSCPVEPQPDATRLPPPVSCKFPHHAPALGVAAAGFGQPTCCTLLP